MELKLLNENKLKITLTSEDMAELDITFEDMNYNHNTNAKRVIWEILDRAKRQTGFDAADAAYDQVLIQALRGKNDGCLIFVTKIGANKPEPQYPAYVKSYRRSYAGIKKKHLIYMFRDSNNLFEVCRQLTLIGYNGKSDIFADREKFYLYVEDNREQYLDIIGEYGEPVNNPFFGFYLDEHAKKIIEADAVQTFAYIFN